MEHQVLTNQELLSNMKERIKDLIEILTLTNKIRLSKSILTRSLV